MDLCIPKFLLDFKCKNFDVSYGRFVYRFGYVPREVMVAFVACKEVLVHIGEQ